MVTEKKLSDFRVANDYKEFSVKMEDGDTIFIDANLSLHGYQEYDRLRIVNHNNQIRMQVIELRMYDGGPETIEFPEVTYVSYKDTMSLENIFTAIEPEYCSDITRPFFTITNPREKDTVRLTTKSATQKQMLRDRFFSLYNTYYSKQRDELCEKYFTAC